MPTLLKHFTARAKSVRVQVQKSPGDGEIPSTKLQTARQASRMVDD
jgi:hypothetical protein